jgi:hypothetical protein
MFWYALSGQKSRMINIFTGSTQKAASLHSDEPEEDLSNRNLETCWLGFSHLGYGVNHYSASRLFYPIPVSTSCFDHGTPMNVKPDCDGKRHGFNALSACFEFEKTWLNNCWPVGDQIRSLLVWFPKRRSFKSAHICQKRPKSLKKQSTYVFTYLCTVVWTPPFEISPPTFITTLVRLGQPSTHLLHHKEP